MATAKYSRYFTYIKPVIENPLMRSFAPYIFSLVAISVLIVAAIRPTISTITNLQKTLADNQQILSTMNQKAQSLSEGRTTLQNLNPDTKKKIQGLVPPQANITYLIASLQQSLGQQASISALQIQPVTIFDLTAPLSTQPKLGEVSLSFNIEGTYNQLLSALYQLSKNSRILNITSINFNKPSEGSLIVSITGKAYFLK
jgi:Tfp pilus assembly protein PilO